MDKKTDITLHITDNGKHINKYYNSSQFSDIILIPNDKSTGIPCHRLVLNKSGDYFERLLNGNFNDGSKNEIVLHDFSYYWLDKFIQYIYTSVISFNYDEFEAVLKYGSYLQLYNFTTLLNDNISDEDIERLIEVNGPAKILELSKIYNISKCYNFAYFDIVEKRDEDILLALPFDLFKEILSVLPIPIDYSDKIKEKYNDQQLDITVMNGKCFGNIFGIYEVFFNYISYQNYTYILNNEIISYTYDSNTFNVCTTIRNNITMITINNTEYDSILTDIKSRDMPNLLKQFKIFSPNDNVSVIAGYIGSLNYIGIYHIYDNISRKLIYDKSQHEDMFTNNHSSTYIAFSPQNTYFVTFKQRTIYCDVLNISNFTVSKFDIFCAELTTNCCYTVYDVCYINGVLYVAINQMYKLDHTTADNSIYSINPDTGQMIHRVNITMDTISLLMFKDVLYGVFYDQNKYTVEFCEIKDNELINRRTLGDMNDHYLYCRFALNGSYLSNRK